MKREFVDSFIDMKLDECDVSIKEITAKLDEMHRLEYRIECGTAIYDELFMECVNLSRQLLRVTRSKSRLLSIYNRRNMEAFFEDNANIN